MKNIKDILYHQPFHQNEDQIWQLSCGKVWNQVKDEAHNQITNHIVIQVKLDILNKYINIRVARPSRINSNE
jgi:hypothetical protein